MENPELPAVRNSNQPYESNLPTEMLNIKSLADTCDSLISKVSSTIDRVSSTVLEINQLSSQVKLETARIEASLEALTFKAQRDMKLYEQSLPLLDKQFSMYQQRMDMLMTKAVDMIGVDFSDSGLDKHEALINLIEITNDGLNKLITKLIPQY